jgi:hypothetical protein
MDGSIILLIRGFRSIAPKSGRAVRAGRSNNPSIPGDTVLEEFRLVAFSIRNKY